MGERGEKVAYSFDVLALGLFGRHFGNFPCELDNYLRIESLVAP